MDTIKIPIVVTEDRRLVIQLPDSVPAGPAELVINTYEQNEATVSNAARELAKIKLLGAGRLAMKLNIPENIRPLSKQEEERLARLFAADTTSLDLINEDRGRLLSTIFLDTSAVAKRYIAEVGSSWLKAQIEPTVGNICIIAELAIVEIFSLLARKQREGRLAINDLLLLQNNFLLHTTNDYLVVLIDSPILVQARFLVKEHSLRTLDAIQLSCALDARALLEEPMLFLSADTNLLSAAAIEGFQIDNPDQHP